MKEEFGGPNVADTDANVKDFLAFRKNEFEPAGLLGCREILNH